MIRKLVYFVVLALMLCGCQGKNNETNAKETMGKDTTQLEKPQKIVDVADKGSIFNAINDVEFNQMRVKKLDIVNALRKNGVQITKDVHSVAIPYADFEKIIVRVDNMKKNFIQFITEGIYEYNLKDESIKQVFDATEFDNLLIISGLEINGEYYFSGTYIDEYERYMPYYVFKRISQTELDVLDQGVAETVFSIPEIGKYSDGFAYHHIYYNMEILSACSELKYYDSIKMNTLFSKCNEVSQDQMLNIQEGARPLVGSVKTNSQNDYLYALKFATPWVKSDDVDEPEVEFQEEYIIYGNIDGKEFEIKKSFVSFLTMSNGYLILELYQPRTESYVLEVIRPEDNHVMERYTSRSAYYFGTIVEDPDIVYMKNYEITKRGALLLASVSDDGHLIANDYAAFKPFKFENSKKDVWHIIAKKENQYIVDVNQPDENADYDVEWYLITTH